MRLVSTTWEDYLAYLRVVLDKLMEVGLTTKPSKCQLAMAECTYLGNVVGNGVVKTEASKLQAILQFPQSETKKQACNLPVSFCQIQSGNIFSLTNLI